MTDEHELIQVRATVNLPGLRVGASALVDPGDVYVCECLAAGLIVPLNEADEPVDVDTS